MPLFKQLARLADKKYAEMEEADGLEDWQTDGVLRPWPMWRELTLLAWVLSLIAIPLLYPDWTRAQIASPSTLPLWLAGYGMISVSAFILFCVHRLPLVAVLWRYGMPLGQWRREKAKGFLAERYPDVGEPLVVERYDSPASFIYGELLFLGIAQLLLVRRMLGEDDTIVLLFILVLGAALFYQHSRFLSSYLGGFLLITPTHFIMHNPSTPPDSCCIALVDIEQIRLVLRGGGKGGLMLRRLEVMAGRRSFNSGWSLNARGVSVLKSLTRSVEQARKSAMLPQLDLRPRDDLGRVIDER